MWRTQVLMLVLIALFLGKKNTLFLIIIAISQALANTFLPVPPTIPSRIEYIFVYLKNFSCQVVFFLRSFFTWNNIVLPTFFFCTNAFRFPITLNSIYGIFYCSKYHDEANRHNSNSGEARLLLSVTDWFSWLLGISIKNSQESPSGRWCRELVKWTWENTQHYFPNSLSSKAYLVHFEWYEWIGAVEWELIVFLYLKTVLSDCNSGAGKATASEER